LALNYLDHVKEGPQKDNIPKFQSIFFRMLTSLTPHLQPLMRPTKSIQLDYEAELVVVIGKRAKHLTMVNANRLPSPATPAPTKARCVNISANTTPMGHGQEFRSHRQHRALDGERRRMPKGGKGPQDHEPLNGNTMQSSNTDHFMFPVAESLVYLTEGMTLEPGDVILPARHPALAMRASPIPCG